MGPGREMRIGHFGFPAAMMIARVNAVGSVEVASGADYFASGVRRVAMATPMTVMASPNS